MKWSYRLLRVAGIDIRVHATFVLALVIGGAEFGRHFGADGVLFGVLLVLGMFACVTLHELGHSLVAQRFGVTVREIVLLPIGGMARLSREPSRPLHELLVALAGPLVNVVIACGLFLGLGFDLARLSDPAYRSILEKTFEPPQLFALFGWLFVGNVGLAVFNMIPAFPMDGGRVLRALLSFPLGKPRATAVATRVGQLLAVGLMVFGVFIAQNPMLVLIAVFVFFAAGQERVLGRAGEVLDELSAGDVCDPHAVTLVAGNDVGDIVDHALRTNQTLFPVLHGEELVGVVLREEALEVAARLGLRASVRGVLRRNLPAVDARTPILELRALIADAGTPVVITDGRRFLGVLGGDDVARIVSLGARLASAGIKRPKPVPVPAEVSASRLPPAAGG